MKSHSKSKAKKKGAPLKPQPETSGTSRTFPIVGIGASAGGLEAFIQVFEKMPADTGMAFVLVQHLDPTHPSMAVDIIAKSTQLIVEEAQDGTRTKPNHIYIIPPNYIIGIQSGVLKLSIRDGGSGQNMAIDYFFQSLANSEKTRAIGILLSGTGTDGTTGLWAIKAEGGVTYAQDPESAKYPGMPRSAIDAGIVDVVLKPEGIASELSRIGTHPYIKTENPLFIEDDAPIDTEEPGESQLKSDNSITSETLSKIFDLLRTHKKVDFSGYKQTTTMRRILRRMMVQKTKSIEAYLKYLETHNEEVHALYNDLLINVTDFFRDPDSFKELTKHVFQNILKHKPKGSTIRIWVPGCSTGEEVYSIAIVLLELLQKTRKQNSIQIFATDISEYAIHKARMGYYSESVVHGLTKERLKRYFDKVEGGYQINKSVRSLCLFSRHDVTNDPPFAKLDLISCRNVMIYFGKLLQKRVIPIFHYALLPGGFLWLGRSENLVGFSHLFASAEKANKIYSKTNVTTPMIHLAASHLQTMTPKIRHLLQGKTGREFQVDADKIILAKYAPPGVIVDSNLEILQFRGRTVPYLEPATGQPSLNLLKMARPELLAGLRTLIQSAKKENKAVERNSLLVDIDGKHHSVDVEVIPIDPKVTAKEKTFLVLFKESFEGLSSRGAEKPSKEKKTTKQVGQADKDAQIAELMRELSELKSYQQALVEQYEATQEELMLTNEELQSTNEEFQSTNEEFQSTNEEIETAKEELQSTNEELITVNEELQIRNTDLTTLSSDLNNLLISIEVPVLIVGGDYRIRRFSPKANSAFNLIPSDIGRPLGDIKPNFDLNLNLLISEVIGNLKSKLVEIQDYSGNWIRLNIRPYETIYNKIDGAIISIIDIDDIKKREESVTQARIQAEKANLAKDVFLANLSHELRTPLSSILTWAQLIAKGKVDFEKAKQGAAVIEQNAKTQNHLIDDLLDISRIIIGKLAIDTRSIDPALVIRSAMESVRPMAEKNGIQILVDLPGSVEIIRADPTRLQQIIWNLLNNAIKFSPKSSTINIELKFIEDNDKRFARIKVSNTGKGIPPDFLPYIFNRFSQADGSSTRIHGGLGLGLSIVYSLVELQSGTVIAENAADGNGAVFTVTFPVVSYQTAITKAEIKSGEKNLIDTQDEGTNQTPNLDGLLILIVDDDEGAREAIAIYLKSFGAEVVTAASAAEALEIFSRVRPSILLSDIAMPGEDGYSLMRKIRVLDKTQGGDIPALSVSAYSSEKDAKHSLEAGFQAHVTKPVEATQLARLILKMIPTHS
jgi:two-component system, chemotaxis family, CheB/CheR fusion protein